MATTPISSPDKTKHDVLKSTERVAELKSIQRDLSVTEIASKFKGNSVIESRVTFQQKQRKMSQKDRLLMKTILQFQNNRKELRKSLRIETNPSPASTGYNTTTEDDFSLPEPLSKLQTFWSGHDTTPTTDASHRTPDFPKTLSPKRSESSLSPFIEKVSTMDLMEALEKNGITINTLGSEDWEQLQAAMATVVEEHRAGQDRRFFPNKSETGEDFPDQKESTIVQNISKYEEIFISAPKKLFEELTEDNIAEKVVTNSDNETSSSDDGNGIRFSRVRSEPDSDDDDNDEVNERKFTEQLSTSVQVPEIAQTKLVEDGHPILDSKENFEPSNTSPKEATKIPVSISISLPSERDQTRTTSQTSPSLDSPR